MAELYYATTETDHKRHLAGEIVTIYIANVQDVLPCYLSIPHRQEKRVAYRELVNHEVNHEEAY